MLFELRQFLVLGVPCLLEPLKFALGEREFAGFLFEFLNLLASLGALALGVFQFFAHMVENLLVSVAERLPTGGAFRLRAERFELFQPLLELFACEFGGVQSRLSVGACPMPALTNLLQGVFLLFAFLLEPAEGCLLLGNLILELFVLRFLTGELFYLLGEMLDFGFELGAFLGLLGARAHFAECRFGLIKRLQLGL